MIAADLGYTAPAVVGAGLAVADVFLFTVTVWLARRVPPDRGPERATVEHG